MTSSTRHARAHLKTRDRGRLSLVATPIGNLEDITLRALRTLREADLVLAEDTRRSRKLLSHHNIPARLRAFHAHSGPAAVARNLADLGAGMHLALVSDAGSPLISDPGSELVRAASEAGYLVESIPGPSAVIAAISVSALRSDTFRFVGFLPRTGKRRRLRLQEIADERGASVLFEAAARLHATLGDLAESCGREREMCLCRELTKVHETALRAPIGELLDTWSESEARGEITLVVAGREGERIEHPDPLDLDARIDVLLAGGVTPRDVARQLQDETGVARRTLYDRVQQRLTRST